MDNLTKKLVQRGVLYKKEVISAFENNPRNRFVDSKQWEADFPLPIGHGQTISQPSTVAMMTQWLDVKKNHIVLEIGTGSGWQAAILSDLAKQVHTFERIRELYENSKKKLKGKNNVFLHFGDGSKGMDRKKFDRIIVTAGARKMPEKLINCLKNRGKMIIPIGMPHQRMLLISKEGDKIKKNNLGWFSFVPLIED